MLGVLYTSKIVELKYIIYYRQTYRQIADIHIANSRETVTSRLTNIHTYRSIPTHVKDIQTTNTYHRNFCVCLE